LPDLRVAAGRLRDGFSSQMFLPWNPVRQITQSKF